MSKACRIRGSWTPRTFPVSNLAPGATRVLAWDADFRGAPAGVHYISFVSEDATGRSRAIKKIFVTRVQFDPATITFSAETPEGTIQVTLNNLVGPKGAAVRPPATPIAFALAAGKGNCWRRSRPCSRGTAQTSPSACRATCSMMWAS